MEVDLITVGTAAGTWATSMIATVAVIKAEIKWIVRSLDRLHHRVDRLEKMVERRQAAPLNPYTGPERRAT